MRLTEIAGLLNPEANTDWSAVDTGTQTVHGDQATWWVQATAGVNYYRADLPARHLPGRTVMLNETDVHADGQGGHVFRRHAGTAVWMFPGNLTRWILMAEMKTQGIPVWVEIDDNYTRPPTLPQLSSWRIRRDQTGGDHHSYECHRKIVQSKACDGLIVSTRRLADAYRNLHANIHVCRNSIDPDDWPDGMPEHQPDGVLRVGYAGSFSHAYDIADIRAALDWAARQPDVEVVILGQPELAALLGHIPHRLVPWTDSLHEYRRNVSQIDVMLCPLRPNPWADCKSDVKALEAAMGGACSVVSRTEPYRPWWDGEAPGYVADSPKGFVKIVKHLVAHRDEARETARLAREYATGMRNIRGEIGSWRHALA